jgi:di/tricarboxylate transporter
VISHTQDGKEVVVESWVSRNKQALLVATALVVFGFLLAYPIFKEPEKQNCLALLVFASLLWCTEAIPLFVTSMLVPFLIVVLRVLDDTEQEPPARLTPKQAAPAVFHTMFSQVRRERQPWGCWLHTCYQIAPQKVCVIHCRQSFRA